MFGLCTGRRGFSATKLMTPVMRSKQCSRTFSYVFEEGGGSGGCGEDRQRSPGLGNIPRLISRCVIP